MLKSCFVNVCWGLLIAKVCIFLFLLNLPIGAIRRPILRVIYCKMVLSVSSMGSKMLGCINDIRNNASAAAVCRPIYTKFATCVRCLCADTTAETHLATDHWMCFHIYIYRHICLCSITWSHHGTETLSALLAFYKKTTWALLISSRTLLSIWLVIHSGIKVNPC